MRLGLNHSRSMRAMGLGFFTAIIVTVDITSAALALTVWEGKLKVRYILNGFIEGFGYLIQPPLGS
tara:strand:- start:904 stop:1101 length:198 start_codon:yes stop_codon:yes gene_type:complete